jgi:hypothetical protein
MRGKKTFVDGGHPTSRGMFVPPVHVTPAQWEVLSKCIESPLSTQAMMEIVEGLELYQSLMIEFLEEAKIGDVRKTLLAISEERDPLAAKDYFHDADSISQFWIVKGMYRAKITDASQLAGSDGEAIVLGARIGFSLFEGSPKKLGRTKKYYQRMTTRFALEKWEKYGGKDFKVWGQGPTDLYAYPRTSKLHQWISLFFNLIGEKVSISQIQLLVKEVLLSKKIDDEKLSP